MAALTPLLARPVVRGPATGTRRDQEARLLEFSGIPHGVFKRAAVGLSADFSRLREI